MALCQSSSHKAGFTLIELSIVLVIIGLIIGGVLVGRDMIKAAELRSVITDVERYKTAVNTFRGKYNCLPGDCANATDFFGIAIVCPDGLGRGTCNGNSDGVIYLFTTGLATYNFENFRAWQQLGYAGLIGAHLTGAGVTIDGQVEDNVIGVNVPASRIAHSGYAMIGCAAFAQTAGTWYPGSSQGTNCFTFGDTTRYDAGVLDDNGNTHYSVLGPALTPTEAMSLDMKADDGLPATGAITAPPRDQWYFGIHCTTAGMLAYANAAYATDYGDPACSLIFRTEY